MVKTGDIVNVKVMEVDEQRKRIALCMRLDDNAEPTAQQKKSAANNPHYNANSQPQAAPKQEGKA